MFANKEIPVQVVSHLGTTTHQRSQVPQTTREQWGKGVDDPHNGFAITRSEFLASNNGSGHYKSKTVSNRPLIACLSLAIARDPRERSFPI